METIKINLDDVEVTVTEWTSYGVSDYEVSWSDGVANSWIEMYQTLSQALTRVAVLAECVASDKMFTKADNSLFAIEADKFLEEQVV